MTEKTRLQIVAKEFGTADEALRKAMLRAEKAEKTLAEVQRLSTVKQPTRVWVVNPITGHRELHSLPLR